MTSTYRSSRPGSLRDRRTVLLLGLAAAVFVLHQAWAFRLPLIDDAFISYRYAENLAGGQGLVFNPGVRVEGYTNFLWVILLAVGKLLGMNLPVGAVLLGALFGLATLVVTTMLYRESFPEAEGFHLFPPFLLAFSGPFTLWCWTGMETAFFTFLVTVGVLGTIREAHGKGWGWGLGVLVLAALTRPEGLLFLVGGLLYLAFQNHLREKSWKHLWIEAGAAAAIIGTHFLWRHGYYGYWLPNTFYAKTGGGGAQVVRGLGYLYHFFQSYSFLWLFVPVMVLVQPFRLRRLEFLGLLSGAYLGAVAVLGGDWMPFFRFVVPVLPLLAVLVAAGLEVLAILFQPTLTALGKSAVCTAVLFFAGLLVLPSLASNEASNLQFETNLSTSRIAVGKWLKRFARPGDSLAIGPIGIIPYFCGLKTYDMLGLTEPEVAHRVLPHLGQGTPGHEKHDYAYILSRHPTYILDQPTLQPAPRTKEEMKEALEGGNGLGLWDFPDFHRLYRVENARIGTRYLTFFTLIQDSPSGTIFFNPKEPRVRPMEGR